MKRLLRNLLSVTLISSTIWPVIACSSSKTVANEESSEGQTDIIMNDVKETVKDFFHGSTTIDEGKTENSFNVINTKLLGIDSIDTLINKLKDVDQITDNDIISVINKYIEEYKLPELQKILRNQYRETFAEDTEDFISINSTETNIRNDTSSLNFNEAAKILMDNANLKMEKKLKSADIKEITDSIIKLNIKVTISISSKYLNMKVEPEFSYYVTNKEKATTEIIQRLYEIVKHQIENNLSAYYQKFLNKKLAEGKIKKSDLLNLGQAKVIREILLTYFNINGSNANEIDLKLGAVLPKVIDINKKTTNILDFLKHEVILHELFKNTEVGDQTMGEYFHQETLNHIRKNFNEKISSLLEVDSGENINLFKMNLKLSRIQILGFSIGEIQINDVLIKWNMNDIITDMNQIFEYVKEILGGFIRDTTTSNFLYATDPIWDPKEYKDIPKLLKEKPEKMSQEEYDNNVQIHYNAIRKVIKVDFMNWMTKRLESAYGEDDPNLKNLNLTTKVFPRQASANNFKSKLYLEFDIEFKLGKASFKLSFRDFWIYNNL